MCLILPFYYLACSNLLCLSFIAPTITLSTKLSFLREYFSLADYFFSEYAASSLASQIIFQSSFECPSQLCFSILQLSNCRPLFDKTEIEIRKMKSLLCGTDVSVKVVTVPKDCSLLVVNMSFQSSPNYENDTSEI
jgi:hypothetical protein